MQSNPGFQVGGSRIIALIFIASFAYSAYIGIQYGPQWIESRAVQSVLDDMERSQRSNPVYSVASAKSKLIRMLQINELNDLTGSFKITTLQDSVRITFDYDRDLDLVFQTRTIHYGQSVRLFF